jgi:hypothetical protein
MLIRKAAAVPPRQRDPRRQQWREFLCHGHLELFHFLAGVRRCWEHPGYPLRRGDHGAVPWLHFACRGTVQATGHEYRLPQRHQCLCPQYIPCLLSQRLDQHVGQQWPVGRCWGHDLAPHQCRHRLHAGPGPGHDQWRMLRSACPRSC